MKKQLVAFVLIMGLAMTTVASADWAKGKRGYANCPQMQGQMFQQLDKATQDKIKQFFKDTLPLHKEMAMKRAEMKAIMGSDKPDPQAASKVAGELFDLRTTMQEKAELAGISQYVGPGHMGSMGRMGRMDRMGRMGCGGYGQGWGMGPGVAPMNNNEPQQKSE